jgi:hypothetical protein
MALKTKYTGEKDQFEKIIFDLSQAVKGIEKENVFLNQEIENTNKNYYDLTDKFNKTNIFFKEKILELTEKVINENNTKEFDLIDKDELSKFIYKLTSENMHHNRTIEKNKLFKENKDEKNKIAKDKAVEKLNNIDKLVVKTLIEKEILVEKFETNQKQKQIEQENSELIFHLNK